MGILLFFGGGLRPPQCVPLAKLAKLALACTSLGHNLSVRSLRWASVEGRDEQPWDSSWSLGLVAPHAVEDHRNQHNTHTMEHNVLHSNKLL